MALGRQIPAPHPKVCAPTRHTQKFLKIDQTQNRLIFWAETHFYLRPGHINRSKYASDTFWGDSIWLFPQINAHRPKVGAPTRHRLKFLPKMTKNGILGLFWGMWCVPFGCTYWGAHLGWERSFIGSYHTAITAPQNYSSDLYLNGDISVDFCYHLSPFDL